MFRTSMSPLVKMESPDLTSVQSGTGSQVQFNHAPAQQSPLGVTADHPVNQDLRPYLHRLGPDGRLGLVMTRRVLVESVQQMWEHPAGQSLSLYTLTNGEKWVIEPNTGYVLGRLSDFQPAQKTEFRTYTVEDMQELEALELTCMEEGKLTDLSPLDMQRIIKRPVNVVQRLLKNDALWGSDTLSAEIMYYSDEQLTRMANFDNAQLEKFEALLLNEKSIILRIEDADKRGKVLDILYTKEQLPRRLPS